MVIHFARRNNQYAVIPMRYDNFFDLKQYVKDKGLGFKIDQKENRVNWLKLKVIKVMKETPNEIHVKENFDDLSFRVINLRRSDRGRPSVSLKQKYGEKSDI